MKHSLKVVAVAGAIGVAVVIGLNAWHANREAAEAAAAEDAMSTPAPRSASRETESLPEPPDRAPESVADPVAATEAPAETAQPREDIPQSEYRAVAMPATSSEVPSDAGQEWVRAFRKQERDEAWARPLETEIQKSLQADIDQGRFYVANIECRTTLCEVRLMAQGSLQVAELELFQSELSHLPWVARLDAALASGGGNRESYEAVWIFEKRPEPATK